MQPEEKMKSVDSARRGHGEQNKLKGEWQGPDGFTHVICFFAPAG